MSRLSHRAWLVGVSWLIAASIAGVALAAPEEVKVTEVAPGVFFRKAQTKPVFTGCNQGWVVFKNFVLVIDANFPGQAEEVIGVIRKTTDKPIKFVFDTHYHGDHADGNPQYVKIGATVIAHERSQPLFETKGAAGFGKSQQTKAKEYGELSYEIPSLYFSHKLIFDDGQQRVELMFLGHAHTAGDAVAWLPRQQILFTGDACVNGAFNYTGDSNTESWITALGAMGDMPLKTLCPGHGEMGGKEIIDQQKRYFIELRAEIKRLSAAGRTLDQIKQEIDLPFYEQWAGVNVKTRTENIEHVFKELTTPQPPLKKDKEFGRWLKLPGQGEYAQLGSREKLGACDLDQRFDALAELYLESDAARRRELRDYFRNDAAQLNEMQTYVRRCANRLKKMDDLEQLRNGLAIAAIEGGRIDYRDTIVSLVLLRHQAETAGIRTDGFYREIQDCVAIENRPLFENARTQSAADIERTLKVLEK